ncbi:acyltransferase [Fusibacter bizertensis]
MTKKNYTSIHYMRIIACLMVIGIHITAAPVVFLDKNSISQLFFLFINQISKPAVPIFIFISGFLMHHIYTDKPLQLLSYYKKRLPSLVIPYIIWSLGYYFLYTKLGFYPLDLKFVFSGLLWGTFIYHLYFMVIIIQMYILYPLLKVVSNRWGEVKMFLGVLAIQLLLIKVPFEHRDRIFITYMSYFAFGLLFQSLYKKINFKSISSVIMFALFVLFGILNAGVYLVYQNGWFEIASIWDSLIYVDLSLSAIIVLIIGLESFDQKHPLKTMRSVMITNQISRSTQFIYYAHPLFILLSEHLMNQLGILSISLRAISAFMMIVLFLLPLAFILESWKTRLIGKKKV